MHTIRRLQLSDIDEILALEQQIQICPWTKEMLMDSLQPHYVSLVLLNERKIIGYIIVMIIVDEAEILNIGVQQKYQGRWLGRNLLNYLINLMQQQKINKIFLEVRESNLPARKLYEGVGFKKIGIRKNYYQTENAVNYELQM